MKIGWTLICDYFICKCFINRCQEREIFDWRLTTNRLSWRFQWCCLIWWYHEMEMDFTWGWNECSFLDCIVFWKTLYFLIQFSTSLGLIIWWNNGGGKTGKQNLTDWINWLKQIELTELSELNELTETNWTEWTDWDKLNWLNWLSWLK